MNFEKSQTVVYDFACAIKKSVGGSEKTFAHGFSLRPRVGAVYFLIIVVLFFILDSSGRNRPTNRLFPGLNQYVSW